MSEERSDLLTAAVLVLVDTGAEGESDQPAPASADLLAGARTLTQGEVIALVLGEVSDELARALGACGADRVLAASMNSNGRVPAAAAADALVQAVRTVQPAIALVTSDYRGKELAGRAAVLLGSACASDVAQLRASQGSVEASKLVLSGSWATTIALVPGNGADARTPVLAVRAGAFAAEGVQAPAEPRSAGVESCPVTLSDEARAVEVVDTVQGQGSEGPELSEARTVVVGGRGVDGDFDLVRRLARPLEAAVGATRVACDEGWIERSAQVGQTGVSIAPRLYIGLGVSGAVHHTSGIQGAGTIVAICDDSEAPIFEMADFGVVGDVTEVVPQLVEELARLRA